MSAISLEGVRKEYPGGLVAVDDIDLEVGEGEFVALLGPTGCGKSTVLRMVAGLEEITAGVIRLDGRVVNHVSARDRHIAMVFQDFALYPHLTVADNIAFPLRIEISDEAAIATRLADVARLVGVQDLMRRKPDQLSGGQRQRVAMARAIVRRPVAFLLDEPLSNVDAAVRAELRAEIVSLARTLGVATLYVTHDQTEAMTMADRIAVMRRGRIEQIGRPEQVYGDPDRLFVAAFVGTPRTSLLQAAVYARPNSDAVIDLGDQALRIPQGDPRATALGAHHTARVTVGIRPEALSVMPMDKVGVHTEGRNTESTLRARVVQLEHLGNEVLVHLDVGGVPTALTQSQLELPDSPGALAEAVTQKPATHGGADGLRHTLSRLVPHQHPTPPPATARTPYGFYPVYDPDEAHPAPLRGTLALRVALPQRVPAVGESLAVSVNLDQVYLFDHSGDRIRLSAPEPRAPEPPA